MGTVAMEEVVVGIKADLQMNGGGSLKKEWLPTYCIIAGV